MTHLLPSAVLLVVSLLQNQPIRVGEVEFFGYAGVDLARVRAALPLREGDDLEREKWEQEKEGVRQSVRQVTGGDPTDVAATCCDARGELIIYIGLSGKPVRYLPAPAARARLPEYVIRLYDRTDTLLQEALRKGGGAEERSKGSPPGLPREVPKHLSKASG